MSAKIFKRLGSKKKNATAADSCSSDGTAATRQPKRVRPTGVQNC